jgi:hypothetical protein
LEIVIKEENDKKARLEMSAKKKSQAQEKIRRQEKEEEEMMLIAAKLEGDMLGTHPTSPPSGPDPCPTQGEPWGGRGGYANTEVPQDSDLECQPSMQHKMLPSQETSSEMQNPPTTSTQDAKPTKKKPKPGIPIDNGSLAEMLPSSKQLCTSQQKPKPIVAPRRVSRIVAKFDNVSSPANMPTSGYFQTSGRIQANPALLANQPLQPKQHYSPQS